MSDPPPAEHAFPLVDETRTFVAGTPGTIRRAPVTSVLCVAVVAVFFLIALSRDPTAMFVRLGYRNAYQVWSGSAWALATTFVLHRYAWHIALNLLCLWRLGSRIEPSIGSARFALLVVTGAFVSGATQLATFDNVGYGASGVIYALFGFAWVAQRRFPELRAVVGARDVRAYVGWLLLCFVVAFRVIGNGAHLGGMLFGAAVALPFVVQQRRRLALAVPALAIVLSLVVAFICPWSPIWWSKVGYQADLDHTGALAQYAYRRSLRLDPDQPWVSRNLARYTPDAGAGDAAAP